MIHPILIYPRLPLRTKCLVPESHDAKIELLKKDKEALRVLIEDMYETMEAVDVGVGLSSNQIGVTDWSVCVIDPNKSERAKDLSDEQKKRFYMIFPEIVFHGPKKKVPEGCLSVPGFYEDVERAEEVDVVYYTLDSIETGMPVNLPDAQGFLAQIIQHEVDHLNGVCFLDHLSAMKRQIATKKMTKTCKRIQDFQWMPNKTKLFGS